MIDSPIFRSTFGFVCVICLWTGKAGAMPITGWLKDTSFGGGPTATLTAANTNSPVLGNGASNNADNTAIYAPFSPLALANGQRITLSASAQLIGTSSIPDLRWGLFKDDGIGAATGGWLGLMASAESIVWSKDPSGSNFANATFASTTNGRAFVLGQTPEPNDRTFSPGTYNFALVVERFGQELDVRISITNATTGYSIVSPTFTETNPARLTYEFDRVGLLAGSLLDADQVRFSNVDVSVSQVSQPTIQVHSSGLVVLTNPTTETFELTQYELTSNAGSLNKTNWISMDDRENGDPIGNGWDEATSSNANVLAEVNLFGHETLAPGEALGLGNAYSADATMDIAFRFTAGGQVRRGIVEYLQSGDFNRDGSVDAADYVLWRKTFGTAATPGSSADADGNGQIDQFDYDIFARNFGWHDSAEDTTHAMPEPGTWFFLVALVALLFSGAAYRSGRFNRCSVVKAMQAVVVATTLLCLTPGRAFSEEINQVAGQLTTLNSNGAWSWYMDERVIVDSAAGKLLASSVANASGTGAAARNGDIDIVSHDLASKATQLYVLHDNLQADDHNGAAIMVRPDGRYLTAYTRHNSDKLTYYRVSTNPHDATSWQAEQVFDWGSTPGTDFNATYSNLFYLSAENRTYNFARANNRSPNMMISNNYGDTWTYGGKLLSTPVSVGYVNGYLKYASNGVDRIDFIATEHHPRDFNNAIYHGYIQDGKMYRSNGTLVDANIFDNAAPNQTSLTKIFTPDPENGSQVNSRAWTTDLHVDANGNPYAIFTTRANDVPVNSNGFNDHRFWYARYDGNQWNVNQIAKAGARLYPSEQDYTGLIALDPHDPDIIYMSTPIDPRDDADLGVHEIFKGVTSDQGETWSWDPITFNSEVDNLRPTVPIWDGDHTALVWMRGTYRSMVDYDLDIVALTDFGPLVGQVVADLNGDRHLGIDDFSIYLAHMYTDLSQLSATEAYLKGDLNGDFKNNAADFILFRQAYDSAHGEGALESANYLVPEPNVASIVFMTIYIFTLSRHSSR